MRRREGFRSGSRKRLILIGDGIWKAMMGVEVGYMFSNRDLRM